LLGGKRGGALSVADKKTRRENNRIYERCSSLKGKEQLGFQQQNPDISLFPLLLFLQSGGGGHPFESCTSSNPYCSMMVIREAHRLGWWTKQS